MTIRSIDVSVLADLLSYDETTGVLRWRKRSVSYFSDGKIAASHAAAIWNAKYAGTEALNCINSFGYRHGALLDFSVDAHRVVWALKFGSWPDGEIDHIDGDPANNKVGNLRCTTARENSANKKIPKNNRSGVIGVFPSGNKWCAQIRRDGVVIHLGTFVTVADAAKARKSAEKELGFHKNHGRMGIAINAAA